MNQPRHRHPLSARFPPRALAGLALLLWLACAGASAATRAWLDRSQVRAGDTVTLNIETDQPGAAPDYAPLEADFEVGTPFRTGRQGTGALFGVRLVPRRNGTLQVPALRVGAEQTSAQVLRVQPVQAAARGDVFVESQVEHDAVWVQQNVGLVVRLYYATSLVSGELTQEAPDGAALQRIGEDVVGRRRMGNRDYQFVERRFLLVPERSGALRVPAPRFRGQASPRFFDDFFGTDRALAAEGQPLQLQVRAPPADAPQPWLPLQGLRLRYLDPPATARAGEAVEVAVEAEAGGATAAQFPDIPAPQVQGAQVFAERPQLTERFVDGTPRLTVVRRFAIVPLQPGPLVVPGPSLAWWDAAAGRASVARLPALQLEVVAPSPAATQGPAAGASALPLPGAAGADAGAGPRGGGAGDAGLWPWMALALGLLWLATLAWALQLRRQHRVAHGTTRVAPGAAVEPGAPAPTTADLRRALDADSFDAAVRLLQAMAHPPARDLDEVLARLADPGQRDALQAMRRALWAGDGDPARARLELRAAFRGGPRWAGETGPAAVAGSAQLPPLYPRAGP